MKLYSPQCGQKKRICLRNEKTHRQSSIRYRTGRGPPVSSGIGMPKKRSSKILLALFVIFAIAAGCLFLFWYSARGMFYENRRFVLRQVTLHSAGWWNGKEKVLCEILNLNPGTTNLFSVRLDDLRRILRQTEPGIQAVSVRRVLPDTLEFHIVERIPRAFINGKNSELLFDTECVVIRKDKCVNLSLILPVIQGIPNADKLTPGDRVESVNRAMELILLTLTLCPDIRMRVVCPLGRDQLICAFYYKDRQAPGELFRAYMYDSDLPGNLNKLLTALERIRATNSSKREIDLRYRNLGVIR